MDALQKLPVWSTSKRAVVLPFKELEEFTRLAIVPIALTLASLLLSVWLACSTGHRLFDLLWFACFACVSVPFVVGWTKLVVEGPASIEARRRRYFPFGKTERHFLIATILLVALLWGPTAIAWWWAYYSHWELTRIAIATAVLVGVLIIGWRFMFLLTTIALDRYEGLVKAWRQTKGVWLRAPLIAALSSVPIGCAHGIADGLSKLAIPPGTAHVIVSATLNTVFTFLTSGTAVAAIALCYQFKVGEEGTESESFPVGG